MRRFSLLLTAVLATAAAAQGVQGDYIARNFKFASGESLPELRLHYTTLGTPRKDAQGTVRNAVMVLNGTGGTGRGFLSANWSGELFGPGKLLDTARFFVVLPDDIGHGGSSKPSNGLHAKFPHYDYDDMVNAEHLLLTEGLQVNHLRLVMGTSMGCMHAWVWGYLYPAFADGLVPLACVPAQIAGRNRMIRTMIMDDITESPDYNGGEYAHPHHPPIQRRPSDFDARLPLQDHTLAVQRQVIAILGHHRVDHHTVAHQALFDDPLRRRGRDHPGFLAALAGALFAFGHHHEVLRRLHVQLFAHVVADDRLDLAASLAGALFRRAGDHSLHAWQDGGQLLPPRMLTALLLFGRRRQRLALALCLDLDVAHPGFQIQQLELRVAELLAARTVLLDPLQSQSLFQYLDLQFGPGKFLLQLDDLLGFGQRNGRGTRHVR